MCDDPHSPKTPRPADDDIQWLLAHPGVSDWLKQALRTADSCDPVTLQNDVAVLELLVRRRAAVAASGQEESAT